MACHATYFSNVDESTHEILIAERVDRLLGLFPCCVFHNPYLCQSKDRADTVGEHTRIPT
jgi:hypothetical protein